MNIQECPVSFFIYAEAETYLQTVIMNLQPEQYNLNVISAARAIRWNKEETPGLQKRNR
jgi:hypothetical protein